jgi:hypothetical protein
MQVYPNNSRSKEFFLIGLALCFCFYQVTAQVNTVEFGQNRLQFKNFKWKYYQTPNFNTYFSQNGQPLAKFVLQIAEKELPSIEQFVEYGMQRRCNIVMYNSYNEMRQSNIGLSLNWQTTGGITKLVNNKMIVYYTDDHNDLRRQIRQGIAKVLVENILFGDDLGEFAANQTLLDLPQWLTDGYIEYVAENWNTQLDDQLKSAMLSGKYSNFYNMAYDLPNLAGHAFWYYFAHKYKKENVTYFLYLSRVYRNLNSASLRICKKKFKEVLKDFMTEEQDVYEKDIRGRRNQPKGTVSVVEDINENKDFFQFSPNPAPRSQTYAVVEWKRGLYKVVLHENYINSKVLLKSGVRTNEKQTDPHYPMLAWDGKGNRLAVVYWKEGKVRLFVYDLVQKYKRTVQDLAMFDQVQDFKYMLNSNTLLFSAVKNGQSDIFVYDIEQQSLIQVTNDVYDDLDASYVSFPNKSGIIYSSNRPSAGAPSGDTVLPSRNRYNIFIVDNWNRSEFKQISQLTHLHYGDARYPMQYNIYHFTYVNDESGIANRYAGFFTTRNAGIDTIYRIGDEVLRNPSLQELDSTLKAYDKQEPDTVFAFSVTNDSAYSFALTNYQSALQETKIAGDNGLVSEVRQEGDLKFLYKLKVDESALKKRNINPRLTDFRKQTLTTTQLTRGQAVKTRGATPVAADTAKKQDFFESEFDKEKKDSAVAKPKPVRQATSDQDETTLGKAKLFDYKLKFSADNFTAGFNNDVLVTRYQPYTGSLPIQLGGGEAFNAMFKASVFDLFEDVRFTGAIQLPLFGGTSASPVATNPNGAYFIPGNSSFLDGGGMWYARVDYLKKYLDYSLLYYRSTDVGVGYATVEGNPNYYDAKSFTNIYQAIIKYPFDQVRSLRLTLGARNDKFILRPSGVIFTQDTLALLAPPQNNITFATSHLEYVYDNTITKAVNILNGLRYKAYMDFNVQVNQTAAGIGRDMFNVGFDIRNYYPIYRNFIWAVRAAGDFSWGNQKIVYYLGGADGWLFPKANQTPTPSSEQNYAYQSLELNLRGFDQNVANGNNAMVINSEFRLPIFTTFWNKPINNAFLRNFELTQFIDLGTAWTGAITNISRPEESYTSQDNPYLTVLIKAGGVGPFVGGYGFGARSTLLGYFLRLDTGWPMDGFFRGTPIWYVSMGVDF